MFSTDGVLESAAPFQLQRSQAEVIALLRKRGPLSRTDIAEIVGYSRSKITAVVQRLTELGIVEEIGDGESSGGRRPRVLNFRHDFGYIVGIDMGATSVDLALANFNGTILSRVSQVIDVRNGPEVVLNQIRQLVLTQLEKYQITPDRIYAFGIGVPGPVDFAAGMLIAPPIMPGWDGYPIREFIRETFPNTIVIVDNDVNVMALGELRGGAGSRHDNFIYVKVGTGIGAGIVCKGQIYRGADGCAGDIGHICADRSGPVCHCGNIGCLEAIAAGPPIAGRAKAAALAHPDSVLHKFLDAGNGSLTPLEVGRAAAAGDRLANEIIHDSGRIIGEVLASLVNFFNPSLILIGGGVSGIGHQFLAAIRRGVLHRSLPLSTRHLHIDVSTMGHNAGIVGALALATENVFVTSGEV
ncbi:MAG: ROK family transcriptional regulator [bacterium]|nr:ROK family transcriptional regulator [bacterium]